MKLDVVSSVMSVLGLLTGGTAFVRVLFLKKPTEQRATDRHGEAKGDAQGDAKGEKLVKILYVLADMRGRSTNELHDAVAKVQQQYLHIMKLGIYPMSVGVNTDWGIREHCVPAMFVESSKELARRADGILLMDGWDMCPDCVAVYDYVAAFKKPTFTQGEGFLREKLQKWAVSDS